MKKITFILVALISGTAFAQNSTDDQVDVLAEIVNPITIAGKQNLVFGKIAVDQVAGSVRVSESGIVTYSDPAMKILSTNDLVMPAKFEITAPVGTSYSISIPNSSLTGSGDPMAVSFTHDGKASNEGTGAATVLTVGGLLQVNALQAAGKYTGTVSVTVAYE